MLELTLMIIIKIIEQPYFITAMSLEEFAKKQNGEDCSLAKAIAHCRPKRY